MKGSPALLPCTTLLVQVQGRLSAKSSTGNLTVNKDAKQKLAAKACLVTSKQSKVVPRKLVLVTKFGYEDEFLC